MEELIDDIRNNINLLDIKEFKEYRYYRYNYKNYVIIKRGGLKGVDNYECRVDYYECRVDNYLNMTYGCEFSIIESNCYDYSFEYKIADNLEEVIRILISINYLDNNRRFLNIKDRLYIDDIKDRSIEIPYHYYDVPIKLSYYCIAYYGMTWYEMVFNAKIEDDEDYRRYKESLYFLEDKNEKGCILFEDFLNILGDKSPDLEDEKDIIEYLRDRYDKTETFRDFLNLIELGVGVTVTPSAPSYQHFVLKSRYVANATFKKFNVV